MPTSWADSIAASENAAPLSYVKTSSIAHYSRSSYVPPHLYNHQPFADPPIPAFAVPAAVTDRGILNGPWSGPRIGGGGYMQHASVGGNYNSYGSGREAGRNGGWNRGRDREANPFEKVGSDQVSDQENGGINFDAYEDIHVGATGNNVPPPVSTFAEIDLGEALNANIQRCKYVKPTPVQQYAIPISLAGRDLMACAQMGSGKTAAFCFPIISGMMQGQHVQRLRGARVAFPLALILFPLGNFRFRYTRKQESSHIKQV